MTIEFITYDGPRRVRVELVGSYVFERVFVCLHTHTHMHTQCVCVFVCVWLAAVVWHELASPMRPRIRHGV